jgi:hypothetical protein
MLSPPQLVDSLLHGSWQWLLASLKSDDDALHLLSQIANGVYILPGSLENSQQSSIQTIGDEPTRKTTNTWTSSSTLAACSKAFAAGSANGTSSSTFVVTSNTLMTDVMMPPRCTSHHWDSLVRWGEGGTTMGDAVSRASVVIAMKGTFVSVRSAGADLMGGASTREMPQWQHHDPIR